MSIYEPAEDSYLMQEALKEKLPIELGKKPNLKFLEIGCGSGINLGTAKSIGFKSQNIYGSDINKEAVESCKKLGFNCIQSDLFKNIKGKFDIIVFNPPYLPLDKKEPKISRLETTGGKKGNEIIIRFLKDAKKHLVENGKIFVITSSLASDINFKDLDYDSKVAAEKKMFFEKLIVWELGLNIN